MTARFEGKVAIITGAARGLGASHALAFGREGATVVVTDICNDFPASQHAIGTEQEMNNVVKEILDIGGNAIGIRCDVSKSLDVEAMVQKTLDEFGQIDILVNNAGITFPKKPIWEVTEQVWDGTLDIMLKGCFLCCKYVLPHMIKRKYGKIVNTGSINARAGKNNSPYSAAKAAIHTLTLAMAKDLGEHNINVNCVAPGAVNTPMMEAACENGAEQFGMKPEEVYPFICQNYHILGREITMEDVSNSVLFLSSEEARNVNGQVLYVDGGFLTI